MKSAGKPGISMGSHYPEKRKSIERDSETNTRLNRSQFTPSEKTCSTKTEKQLSPPLPLMKFKFPSSKPIEKVRTITGEDLRNVENRFPSQVDGHKRDKLFDPVYSRKLIKYFTARSQKENNYKLLLDLNSNSITEDVGDRVELFEYCVYESYLHSETSKERSIRNLERKSEEIIQQERFELMQAVGCSSPVRTVSLGSFGDIPLLNHTTSKPPTPVSSRMSPCAGKPSYSKSLQFDGEFECGNIEKVIRVIGRDSLWSGNANRNDHPDFVLPVEVDQEYDITIRKDINTEGNVQWYFFSATAGEDLFSTSSGGSFPLKVRFNLVNMQKKDSLYNYGMKPTIFSVNQIHNEDWIHGGEDICYYRNGLTYIKSSNSGNVSGETGGKKKATVMYHSSLTFTYVFNSPDTVYFAHTYPYSYTDLQYYLNFLESDTRIAGLIHRRTMCKTLAGNNCDILTITERSTGVIEEKIKPSIIVSARVHPGEANSSYMIHGFIEFLTGESPEALKLRKSFVFHIVPMMNPDGVIHGNYRCSLAGTDLNRRFLDTHKGLHPTVAALKTFIQSTQQHRHVLMYLDLHGHSKMKNSFLYGCDIAQQPDKTTKTLMPLLTDEELAARRIYARLFPKILCTVSKSLGHNNFSYVDCNFRMDKSKMGTGRIVSFKEFGIPASYTIEVSFCGNGDNRESRLLRRAEVTKASDFNVSQMTPKSSKKSTVVIGSTDSNAMKGEDEAHCGNLNNIYPVWSTALPTLEPDSLGDLLNSYQSATHYTKQDLLTLGYELGIAVYHFANLTHSNLENELQLATLHDQRLRRQKAVKSSSLVEGSTAVGNDTAIFKSNDEVSPQFSGSSLRTPENRKRLETALRNVDICAEYVEELSLDPASSVQHSASVIVSDEESLDFIAKQNTTSDSSTILTPRSAVLEKYKNSKIDLVEEALINRSMLRPAVYDVEALRTLVRQYKSEFCFPECATHNIGLRVKCEYSIRRWLGLENRDNDDGKEDISVPLLSNSLITLSNDGCGGSDGSESDPSADNVPTSKLLRNVGKYKDTGSLVAALRKELIRKKKKEAEDRSKTEKKRLKHLAKKEKEAKKAFEDAQAELQLQAKRKAEAEALALAQEEARLKALIDRRPSSSVRRKTSIFQSAPKYVPNYRYAPEEKPAAAPVQIKQINFKDFDGALGGSIGGSAYGVSSSTLCNLYNNAQANPLFGSNVTTSPSPRQSGCGSINGMGHSSSYIGEDGVLITIARPKTSSGYPDNQLKKSSSANSLGSHNSEHGTTTVSPFVGGRLSTPASTSTGGIAFASARDQQMRNTTNSFNVLYNCERPNSITSSVGREKFDKLQGVTRLSSSQHETCPVDVGIACDTSVEATALTNRSKSILYSLPTLDANENNNTGSYAFPSGMRGSFTRPKSASTTLFASSGTVSRAVKLKK